MCKSTICSGTVMSMRSISSRPAAVSKSSSSPVGSVLRTVATTCDPEMRYSSAMANPSPREAPMRRTVRWGDVVGIVPVSLGRGHRPGRVSLDGLRTVGLGVRSLLSVPKVSRGMRQ
jgi:hypothetical protein